MRGVALDERVWLQVRDIALGERVWLQVRGVVLGESACGRNSSE